MQACPHANPCLGTLLAPARQSSNRYITRNCLCDMSPYGLELPSQNSLLCLIFPVRAANWHLELSFGVICRHQKSINTALKDADVSIRRRAVDLLFTMCSSSSVKEIVAELLNYLEIADFSMREELVLKTAILAERFPLPLFRKLF